MGVGAGAGGASHQPLGRVSFPEGFGPPSAVILRGDGWAFALSFRASGPRAYLHSTSGRTCWGQCELKLFKINAFVVTGETGMAGAGWPGWVSLPLVERGRRAGGRPWNRASTWVQGGPVPAPLGEKFPEQCAALWCGHRFCVTLAPPLSSRVGMSRLGPLLKGQGKPLTREDLCPAATGKLSVLPLSTPPRPDRVWVSNTVRQRACCPRVDPAALWVAG